MKRMFSSGDHLSQAAGDSISVSVWQRLREPSESILFYGHSPNVGMGLRALVPNVNGAIQWDTAGCCDPNVQSLSRSISEFSGFTVSPDWWKQWHHFVFSKDGPIKRIYIDGTLFHESSNTGSLLKEQTSFSVGTAGGFEFAAPRGWVDDLAVFDDALTPDQVSALNQGGLPSSVPGLAAFWDFNDPPLLHEFDANLITAIRVELGVSGRDLLEGDLLTLRQLSLSGRGVMNLAGLERLVNLTNLNLSVDPNLPLDHAERRRDLSGLNRLTKLQQLRLDGLAVTSLEFMRSMPDLMELHLDNRPAVMSIADYSPLAAAIQMVNLNMRGHALTSAAVFKDLKALRRLWLEWGSLPDATDLASLPELRDLRLHEVGLNALSFLQGMTQFETLALGQAGVSVVPISALSVLQNLTNLTWLALDGRAISRANQIVPYLKPIASLRDLWLSSCPLVDGSALSEMTQLRLLGVPNTRLTSFQFLSGLPQLRALDVRNGNRLMRIPEGDWSVFSQLPNLEYLHISEHGLTHLEFLASNTALQDLWMDYNDLTDISRVASFTQLRSLRVNNAIVSDLSPVMGLAALRHLEVSRNPILPPSLAGGRDWLSELRTSGVNVVANELTPVLQLPTQGKRANVDGLIRGFRGQIHQTGSAPADNTLLRAERQLAGDFGASSIDSAFFEPSSINYDNNNENSGHFGGNRNFPNISALGIDNIAMSATGYVELKAGRYVMGLNSDDGFAVSSGFEPIYARTPEGGAWIRNTSALVLGQFDGGRWASDSYFVVHVPEDGFYPLRLLWEEGLGGANVELWVLNSAFSPNQLNRLLLNSEAAGAPRVYSVPPENSAPRFRTPLMGKVLTVGQRGELIADVLGSFLSFQWRRNGVDLTDNEFVRGTQSNTLVFNPFRDEDVGNYSLVVSNVIGHIESAPVAVTARPSSDFVQLSSANRVVVDPSKLGFDVRVHQVSLAQPNGIVRAEKQLLGLLKDAEGQVLPNIANLSGASPVGRFEISDVLNFNTFVDAAIGAFGGDRLVPGLPGLTDNFNNVAAEILTYIELPQGVVRMAVNSDDGLETSTGNVKDVLSRTVLGRFNGLRGATTTVFEFYVPEAGIYPFRTVWEQGFGGGSIEWFTVKPDGSYVLLNDVANGGFRTYRQLASSENQVAVAWVEPTPNSTNQHVDEPIEVTILDVGQKVDLDRLLLKIEGYPVTISTTTVGDQVRVRYVPSQFYPADSIIQVRLQIGRVDGQVEEAEWSFRTTPIAGNSFFIEAEDFDYGKGQWVQNAPIGMTGPYSGGAYDGLGTGINGSVGDGTDYGIDYNDQNSNPGNAYRLGTAVEVTGRGVEGGRGRRGVFEVQRNFSIGWNDAGDWYNYTRVFPKVHQRYRVFASLSSEGAPMAAELSRVISGVGTVQQTTETLGEFRTTAATGGWDNFTLVELKNSEGRSVQPLLGRTNTIRFSVLPGNLDVDYLAFVPVPNTEIVAPEINHHPKSQSVYVGSQVHFQVLAMGTGPLLYQWRHGTNDIVGATNSVFVLEEARVVDRGEYSVVVRNSAAVIQSRPAELSVLEYSGAPVEIFADSIHAVANSAFAVPVRVRNFNAITSVRFSIHWDPTLAAFQGVSQFGLSGLTVDNFHLEESNLGTVTFVWNDSQGTSGDLADDSTLFVLNLTALGRAGQRMPLILNGEPLPSLITDPLRVNVPHTFHFGEINFVETVSLGGRVRLHSNQNLNIPGVEVSMENGNSQTITTSTAGTFEFTLTPGQNISLRASKPVETPRDRGISALDITLIRRHILGILPLDSPYKLLAADVNGSSSVSALDITLIRRLILGISTSLPSGAWRFVPANHVFPNPASPWQVANAHLIPLLDRSHSEVDFLAIRIGDVNGSWTPAPPLPPPGIEEFSKSSLDIRNQETSRTHFPYGTLPIIKPVLLEVGSVIGSYEDDRIIEVPMSIKNGNGVIGFQFTLSWDPNRLNYVGISPGALKGFRKSHFNESFASTGRLTIAWTDMEGLDEDSVAPPHSTDVTNGFPSGVESHDSEILRLQFRSLDSAPSATSIRIAEHPTPVEVVMNSVMPFVVPHVVRDGAIWKGHKTEVASMLLPGLDGEQRVFRVPTWIGANSIIETTDQLTTPTWRVIEVIPGDGMMKTWRVPSVAMERGQSFYRLRREALD